MGHADFRVDGKVFATISQEADWAMVKLSPPEQESFVRAEPDVFAPFNGAWGRQGYTRVTLAAARESSVLQALDCAWRNSAPKRMREEFDS